MKKSTKEVLFHYREQYYIPEEEGVPCTLTSYRFESEESAKLAQALYNCLASVNKYDPNEFRHLFRHINKMADINPDWQ